MVPEGKIREGSFATLYEEKKAFQNIWSGININNSWEAFLVRTPHSLAALERLMVLSLNSPYQLSLSEPVKHSVFPESRRRCFTESAISERAASSVSDFAVNESTAALKSKLIEILNEARSAVATMHDSSEIIACKTNEVSAHVKAIIDYLNEKNLRDDEGVLNNKYKMLHTAIDECAKNAFSLENVFEKTLALCDEKQTKIGRSGFMLLGEVRHFWERLARFCDEMSKLVEFAIDPSCNALIAIVSQQVFLAAHSSNYAMKRKVKKQIYRRALASTTYTLLVRHLAGSFAKFSSEFILPQIECISHYTLVSNSEVELKNMRLVFAQRNALCEKEVNQTVQKSSRNGKRKSILELDFGLDLHMSDILDDLNELLQPIANFRKDNNPFKSEGADTASERKLSEVIGKVYKNFQRKPRSSTM